MTTKLRRETIALATLCVAIGGVVCGVTVVASANGGSHAPSARATPSTAPVTDQKCPPGTPGPKNPDVMAVVNELDGWSSDPQRNRYYLGRFPCPETKSVVVYRLPGHPDLDQQAQAVGARHHVTIVLADSDAWASMSRAH